MDNYYIFIFKSVVPAFNPNRIPLHSPPFKKYGGLLIFFFMYFGGLHAQINHALHLSENSDYVEIPHNNAFNFTGSFTLSFWVKAEKNQTNLTSSVNSILMKSGGGATGIPFGFQMVNTGVNTGKVKVVRKNSTGTSVNYLSTIPINDGRFHYVSLVRDSVANNLKLYIDAILQGGAILDISGTKNNNSSIYLGRNGDGTENFKGSIDEIRIWRTARTAPNLQSDRNSTIPNISGLVAYYPMETGLKNKCTTTTTAQSVNGFGGGSPYFYPSKKNYGNALHFDGNNDLVSISANPGTLNDQLTVEAWIRPSQLESTQTIAGQTGKWALKMQSGKINFSVQTTSNTELKITANFQMLETDRWYHVACVYNGNGANKRLEIFINGELDNKITLSATSAINTSGIGMLIGANGSPSSSNEHFEGMMDEINVWRIERPEDSIVLDMNKGSGYTSSNHLVYYRCDQGNPGANNSGLTTLTNYTAGNNATLVNFALTGSASNWVARAPHLGEPEASLVSGTIYNFADKILQEGTSPVLGSGILADYASIPTVYPDYTNSIVKILPLGVANIPYLEGYGFTQTVGAYSPIAGGYAVVSDIDDNNYTNLPIGFSFTFNKITYTTFTANANGYIGLGETGSNGYYLPSISGPYNNLISAFCADLQGDSVSGEFRFETIGSAPNRTLVVQWSNFDFYPSSTSTAVLNFQIRLNESDNSIEVKYGAQSAAASPVNVEVGLKGSSLNEFNNRRVVPGTNIWSSSQTGNNAYATCTFQTGLIPATGQSYKWSPPTVGFYYKSYAFGQEGVVISGESSGPCITGFPIGNITFSSGSSSITANWPAVSGTTGYDWILTTSTGEITSPLQSGSAVSTNVTLANLDPGSRYYFYVRSKCGGGVGEWVGPAYFSTLSNPSLTATDLQNDEFVEVNWALPTAYFAQNAPLGVYLQLKNGNTVLYNQSITDYSNYIGETQPSFSYVGSGNALNYHSVNNSTGWPQLSQWTMETWIKTGATNTNAATILRTTNGAADSFSIVLDSVKRIKLRLNSTVLNFSYSQIPVEQWFHLAIVYGNGNAQLYINGVSVESLIAPEIIINGSLFQALYAANQTSMAELRFWNRVRTSQEIKYSLLTPSFNGIAQNNLLLHWKWNTDAASPQDLAQTYDGVNNNAQVKLVSNGANASNVNNPNYVATPFYTAIRGTFRHILGPNQTRLYRLSGYQVGPGTIINAAYFPSPDTGKTLPYQSIEYVRADSTPFNVQLTWKNKSMLSEYFRIRRTDNAGQNSVTLATISGTDKIDSVMTYMDNFQLADSNSLKNGVTYRYYVDTWSATFNQYFDTLEYNSVNLPPVNVTASDNTYPDKVTIGWNDLSDFGFKIRVTRDDETLETLTPNDLSYTDLFPVYGKRHRYGILLIDPVSNQPVAAGFDRGGIAARGMISGIVYTLEGNYIEKNVRIRLTNQTDGTQDSTLTDNNGNFTFSGLYYAKSGNFTLSAYNPASPSSVFLNSPRTVTLSDNAPELKDVVFLDSTGFVSDTTNTGFTLSNFIVTPVNTEDKVNLSCNYTISPGDTLRMNVFRDGNLTNVSTITSGTNFIFADTTGNPGFVYDYSVSLYKILGDSVKVLSRNRNDILFPPVAIPTAFSATVVPSLGVIDLAWAHTSQNYEGFRIYRANGVLPSDTVMIAEINRGVFNFTDKQTLPGTSGYNYVIHAKREGEDITFESQDVVSGVVSYPSLPSLSQLIATPNANRNSVELTWNLPGSSPLNDTTYNFDGYLIYRTTNSNNVTRMVGLVYKHFSRYFEDKSGIPGEGYTYSVSAFVKQVSPFTLQDTLITSTPFSKAADYPYLKGPKSFARVNNVNSVRLTWIPAVNQSGSARNFDGQTVYFKVGTGVLDSVEIPATSNTYTYYTSATSATPITFTVRSHKYINGIKYVSIGISGLGFATGVNSLALPIPPQFKASENLPEHIRLKWSYPDYILATFKLYRNGSLIAILPPESREYYDYTAANYQDYLYEIEATYLQNTTLKSASVGRRNTLSSLQGKVYAEGSQYGLPYIEVTVTATGYFARTFTDSTGFYSIDNLPVQSSLPVTVTVDGANTVFTGPSYPSTKTFLIEGERYKTYTMDFVSNYSPYSKDTARLAICPYVYATPDPARKQVIIRWTPGNQLHDGFLVYRANSLIGTVAKNEPCVLYDTEGSPGVNYLYQVGTYVNGESEKIFGLGKYTYATFPKVEPVVYLNAVQSPGQNAINVTWSHLWSNHKGYKISRNGNQVSEISSYSPAYYTDTTGIPGNLYNYMVVAVDDYNNTTTESSPQTIQAAYPGLVDITDLSVSIPDTTLCGSNVISRNHVLVQWNYDSKCTGFWVYRNDLLVKILPSTITEFRDTAGTPGLNTEYTVKAYLNRNGVNYSAEGLTQSIQFPVVSAPFNLNYEQFNGFVKIHWSYSEDILYSFEVWREYAWTSDYLYTLKVDSLGDGNFEFVDNTGFMGRDYTYKIRAFVKREGIPYNSDFTPCIPYSVTYPSIAPPVVPEGLSANAVASDGTYTNFVRLEWAYDGLNHDGFKIYRNAVLIATVEKGFRNYNDMSNQTGVKTYEIKAYKIADDNGTPTLVESDPLADNGNIGQGSIGTLAGLSATQGTLNEQVLLTWTPSGSYTIYRDNIQIGTVTGTSFTDNNAAPGKRYIYEVGGAIRTPVQGWAKYDGYIDGFVYTQTGNAGLGSAIVQAQAMIEGNIYYYTDTTDNTGAYIFPQVYYGSGTAFYTITAYLNKCSVEHEFQINPRSVMLSSALPLAFQINFQDKTQYKIKGFIRRKHTSCGIDSVKVSAEYTYANGTTQTTTPVYTNKAGVYILDINPIQIGLESIRIVVDSTRILSSGDTLLYRFVSLGTSEWSGNTLECLDLITFANFEDILTYPVTVGIENGCGQPVTGGKYKIQVQSTDLCYDRTFTTSQTTGEMIADLPPMPLNIHVSGVENLNAQTILVAEYLKYRPSVRPFDSLAAAIHPENPDNLTLWGNESRTRLIYHTPPEIKFKTEPFSKYICASPAADITGAAGAAVIQQNKSYSINLQVIETFVSECEVMSGYFKIRNAAATQPDATLVFKDGKLPIYRFTAGNPNLVKPYVYNCYFSFYSSNNELLAEKNLKILVEGEIALPGSDIILDITKDGEDNTVPLPLYVLRDPPGDASFSKIAEGSTVSKRISLSKDLSSSLGLFLEYEFGTPFGGILANLEIEAGAAAGKEFTWDIKSTTTKEITTGNSSIAIGPTADVIVGAGMAFKYGLTKKISVQGNCAVNDETQLGLAADGIKTEWVYTINQINTLIKEYQWRIQNKDRVKQGDNLLSVEASKGFFQTKIDNWNSILSYHKKETLPFYNLCAKSFDDSESIFDVLNIIKDELLVVLGVNNYNEFLLERRTNFNAWQNGFCKEIGRYENGTFILNEGEITWNQALIDKYNVAQKVLKDIANLQYNPLGYDWQFSEDNLANTQKYLDAQYMAIHGMGAENVTFAAGLEYSKTIESANASSKSYSASTFFNLDEKLGLKFKGKTELLTAPLGIGSSTELFDYEIKVGLLGKINLEIVEDVEKAEELTNLISYTFGDQEQFDQFSITVIQGIEPNQTPYFSLLGGRSSCPYIPGTISLDLPTINLIKDGAATKYDERVDVNPDEPAVFTVQINNGNPFGIPRDIQVVNILQQNTNGAIVELLGDNFADYTLYQLPVDEPVLVQMLVHRGAVAYDYDSLQICVMPRCYFDEPDYTYLLGIGGDTITFSVHFANPCSDIVLTQPEDDWVIHRRNLSATNNQEALPVKIAGFDVSDNAFQRIHFEYRKTGVNNDWMPIPGSVVSRDSLAIYQSLNLFPNEVPYYWYIWDITDNFDRYPNGEYQLRAVATCLINGKTVYSYTNITKGVIDRNQQLLGLPEPADQIWTYGDQIAISFNKDIQCARIDSVNFLLVNKNDVVGGLPAPVPGKIYCHNNRLSFIPDTTMNVFDGDTLQFTVSGVYSVTGELMNDEVWNFVVYARDLYMDKTRFDVQLYQGDQLTLQSRFFNNGNSGGLTYFVRDPLIQTGITPDGTYDDWFTARNACQVSLPNPGDNEVVYFDINGQNMEPGFYEVTFDVRENSYVLENALSFKIQVLPKPSNWNVNPANYESSMTIMTNYQFINPVLPENTDTTDLISVWIDNEIRGVAKVGKMGANHLAIINVYGDAADNGKPLSFRVWDTETGNEYDATPPNPNPKTWQKNGQIGTLNNRLLLNVNQVQDLARYIPFREGWNLFSLNTQKANDSLNKVLSGLRHPQDGDVIKTASRSASFNAGTQTWITADSLYVMDIYHGYQLHLSMPDTLRITGTLPSVISKDSLFNGWNLIGAPLATVQSIQTVMANTKFSVSAQPDSMTLKTDPLPGYDFQNMTAFYKPSQNPQWLTNPSSGMDAIRPNFGYWLKVNKNTNLCMSTAACSGTTVLRAGVGQIPAFDEYDISTWKVNPSEYEYNMLITGYVELEGQLQQKSGVRIAAFTNNTCRGVGNLVFVPELNRYLITLFVYANTEGEEMEFRIYEPQTENYYKHYESVGFEADKLTGDFVTPYRLSNIPPDNLFSVTAYPNPFDRKLIVNILGDQVQDYTVSLCDLMGRTVYSQTISPETTQLTEELKTGNLGLIRGVYILHIKGSLGESQSMKVVFDPN
ncbi:MAG: T9SS type A sorting domain-containing protein [Bacteroidia bacterium]|nr:T9SS type A sorting domain-containing protein [Bacteroidia bacterium]